MKTILITGSNGTIGNRLSEKLKQKGYQLRYLSRNPSLDNEFYWNLKEQYIAPDALENVYAVIHLAGEPVAAKRWTTTQKNKIYSSRVDSTKLLVNTINSLTNKPKVFLSASAIGYYGPDVSNTPFSEEDTPGTDFLAKTCADWENEMKPLKTTAIRYVLFRTGVVFSKKGGAFPKIIAPIKKGFGSYIGSGNQVISWIHIDDLCNLYITALENQNWQGVFNAVAPHPITNKLLTDVLAKKLHKNLWLPSIPPFFMNLLLGKRASLLIDSCSVSATKAAEMNYTFLYPTIDDALHNLV